MSSSTYGYILDRSEENKENIPFPHILENKNTLVLPPLPSSSAGSFSQSEVEIDVVSLTETPLSTNLSQASRCSSQSSVASTVPTPSPSGQLMKRDSSDEMDADSEDGETTSRKEKSLGLLCQRFLIAMNEETRCSLTREVHLETVARKMNVEKRRIYDIVNVMEALDAMNKTNKSFYRWVGLEDLPRLMIELQKEALIERLPERVQRVEQAMCSFTELNRSSNNRESIGSIEEGSSLHNPDHASVSDLRKSRVDSRDRQGRNSLAQLCRRFLMVLLSNPKCRRVSLDVASTVLIKDPETEGFEPPSRSRCRRLYDIANVLVALGLIKKVHYLFGTKKIPLFVYCGPEPSETVKYDANACLERMLVNCSSAPQTPQMKATTAAMVQSLSMGKRSYSDANLSRTLQESKLPKIKSEVNPLNVKCNLMNLAEIAEKFGYANSIPLMRTPCSLPKPQPQLKNVASTMSSPSNSPLSTRLVPSFRASPFSMPGMPLHSIMLPNNNWTNVTSPLASSPLTPLMSTQLKTSNSANQPKHSVSSILGNSTRLNVGLDHKQSSAFQPVRRESKPKNPFGAIQNIPSCIN